MPHRKVTQLLQQFFGLRDDHHLCVPDNIRQATHAHSNEATKLKSAIESVEKRPDVLRELVESMQDKLRQRSR